MVTFMFLHLYRICRGPFKTTNITTNLAIVGKLQPCRGSQSFLFLLRTTIKVQKVLEQGMLQGCSPAGK